jgi:hypothetical protein
MRESVCIQLWKEYFGLIYRHSYLGLVNFCTKLSIIFQINYYFQCGNLKCFSNKVSHLCAKVSTYNCNNFFKHYIEHIFDLK